MGVGGGKMGHRVDTSACPTREEQKLPWGKKFRMQGRNESTAEPLEYTTSLTI